MDLVFRRALYLAGGAHVVALLVTHAMRGPVHDRPLELSPPENTTTTTEMFAIELPDESSGPASIASPVTSTSTSDDAPVTPSPRLAITSTPRPPPIEAPTSETPVPVPSPSEGAPIANAAPTTSGTGAETGKGPYVVPELGKKSSWLLPPILPDAVGAAGTSSPLDPKGALQTKEEKLAAKVSKDVTALVDAQGKAKDGGAGGPVLGAAHVAAHDEPLAPATGIAVFEVKTDASGAVKSVSVLSTDGDAPAWKVVAIAMKKELGDKKLVVPSGANGLKVTVRVQAKFALPSGATGSGVKPFVAGIGGGFAFDLSDIGQKPMRVVSVVELEESRL